VNILKKRVNEIKHINSKESKIILNTGHEVLINTEDWKKLEGRIVYISGEVPVVDIIDNGKTRKLGLHKLIFNVLEKDKKVYNSSTNKLDVRKSNLSLSQNQFIYKDNEVIINTSCDNEIIIEEEDFHLVKDYTWSVSQSGYVYTKFPKTMYIHRLITNCPEGMTVDHIDLNKLNNRKSNLRVCEHMKNTWNRKKYSASRFGKISSQYKGLRRKDNNSWDVRIKVNPNHFTIGTFSNEVAAANAYNYFAKHLHEEYASLNDCEEINNWFDYLIKVGKGSKFRGVHYEKRSGKWVVRINQKHVGTYKNEMDAAIAYNNKAIELGFPITKLNILEHSSIFMERSVD
jgi:hypothetical protein